MTSAAPALAELPGVVHDSNEERNTGCEIQHPWAPKMTSKELPPIDGSIQHHAIAINHGNDQWIPPNLLFWNDIRPRIDSRLAFQDGPRAVAQPSLTCMSEIPEYLWGAVGIPVLIGRQMTMRVDFEQVLDTATVPFVVQMMIRTDTNNIIRVNAGQGRPYVTVVDVQRAVIHWMKETRIRLGVNNFTRRFSRWVRMADCDGAEIEVEVWVWRGLRSLSTDMINWHLHLCED